MSEHGPVRQLVERAYNCGRRMKSWELSGINLDGHVAYNKELLLLDELSTAADALDARQTWPVGDEAQQRIAELEAQLAEAQLIIERARTYKGIEAWACPLCKYKDGVFIEPCEPHRQMDVLEAQLAEARAGRWEPLGDGRINCACGEDGCICALYAKGRNLSLRGPVPQLFVLPDPIRLCAYHPAPAEPEPSRPVRALVERADQNRYDYERIAIDADAYDAEWDRILSAADAMDAHPWPQGDEAAEQLARAVEHVRYAGASLFDTKPAWMRKVNADFAAAVLARLNADTTTKESEQ